MNLDFSAVKKILVVRMRHLGDLLLTSPFLTQLKRTIPHAQIDAFINQESFPMLEGHPALSHYFLYDRGWKGLGIWKKHAKELALLREVRRQKYDLVFNLTEGDRGALIALISGARYRVGFDPGKGGFWGKRKIFTHLVKICPHPRHTVERQLDALRRVGIQPTLEERELFFAVPPNALQKMQEVCGQGFFLIHPVSRWMFKSPPAAFFAELIEELDKRGKRVVLSSGTEEESLAMIEQILSLVPEVPLINMAGKTSLKELGALIQLSHALITVDSVPLHMASALKAPTIALFGPSSEINWGPWQNPHAHVISSPLSCRPCYMDGCGGSRKSDCLTRLQVSQVLEAMAKLPAPPTPSNLRSWPIFSS